MTTSTTPTDDLGTSYRIRRLTVLVIALGLFAAAIWFFAIREDDDNSGVLPTADLALHGWVPYWALEHSIPELDAPCRELRPGVAVLVPNDRHRHDRRRPVRTGTAYASDSSTPHGSWAWRSCRRSSTPCPPARWRRSSLIPPRAPVTWTPSFDFAAEGDYAGVDIDYEQFAFADGRDTWAATRPNWVAFIEELSAKLHGDDRTLTVSIPPVYDADRTDDSGFWVYDYGAITPHVDSIRVMAYDYSTAEPGPISPIKWVQDAIEGTIEASGDPSKLVLGLPLYGYNWPIDVEGDCPSDAPERTSVNIRSVPGLIAERGAEPRWVEQDRRVHVHLRPHRRGRRRIVCADA